MTKQEALEKIEELKEFVGREEKWEPKGGNWHIYNHGTIDKYETDKSFRLFGTEYATEEQAEKARRDVYTHNMLLQLRAERCPDYEPDWGDDTEKKYSISYRYDEEKYAVELFFHRKNLGSVFFPQNVAEQIVKELNEGITDLKYKD